MLEALNWANSDVQMIVGVGAATLDLTRFRDVLGVTVSTLRSLLSERVLTQNAPDFINDAKQALSDFYSFAVTKIPLLGPVIGIIGSIISNIFNTGKSVIDMVLDATAKVFDIFSDLMEKIKVQALIDAQPFVGLTNLNGKAEGVVNIYGDKDLLADLGVGGYRSSISGFTDKLINIEIKSQRGAISDHYTYMHNIRTPQDYAEMGADGNTYQHEFDDRVSNFVARLLVVSKNPQTAASFLNQLPPELGQVVPGANGVYEYYPFGASVL